MQDNLIGSLNYTAKIPVENKPKEFKTFTDRPFDSQLFLAIHVPDQQKELESLQTQRRLAFSMARGKQVGVSDIESEAKFQDLEELVGEMIAQGERVFHVSLNILLKGKSEEELYDRVTQSRYMETLAGGLGCFPFDDGR